MHGPYGVPRPGTTVGKYRIVRRLAIGGMAEVFLAHTRSLHGFEKLVVLKRILPQYAENMEFVRMFLDEARLAAALDHPNIVHVHDVAEVGGSFFIAMEYIHGVSLLKVMRALTEARRPLPLEHALNIVIGVCAGLHHAHERIGLDGRPLGIVHRDVSPPNVLISFDGAVKVVDFGIAKANTATTSTGVGTLKGKIPYMSPEQCRTDPLDRRSDIFSIGIILYELTVGRRLFAADTEIAIIQKITTGGFPPPTSVHPAYPPELEALVMRALQLEVDARFPTARDLQVELEEFAREYKLAISSARLAAFMEDLFDEEARRWPTNPAAAQPSPSAYSPGSYGTQPAFPGQTYGQGSMETAVPATALTPRPPDPDLAAFDEALGRLLDGSAGLEDVTDRLEDRGKGLMDLDLDNLEVEDLDPSKFTKE